MPYTILQMIQCATPPPPPPPLGIELGESHKQTNTAISSKHCLWHMCCYQTWQRNYEYAWFSIDILCPYITWQLSSKTSFMHCCQFIIIIIQNFHHAKNNDIYQLTCPYHELEHPKDLIILFDVRAIAILRLALYNSNIQAFFSWWRDKWVISITHFMDDSFFIDIFKKHTFSRR